ncbi:MAG: hypothetical protein PHO37_13210 [Kiritimatiellae bacterium]|nr:hypothetical protein [Kiritimatiellia bacterium]
MHIHVKNILAALAVMACALPLLAVDRTWDGEGGDLSWDTAENWSADSKPGLGDRARFDSAVVAGSTILLGADQTIDSLFLVGSAAYTLDGGANTLTLATGSIFAGGSSGTSDIKLAGTVVLGTNGVWSVPGGWGSKITVEGVLSDNGMGYGFETASDQNDNHVLTGSNTLSGTILIRCNGFTVAGANGVFTDATVLLDDGMDKNATTLYIDNKILNDDRFGANVVLGASGNGGEIRFNEGEYTYTETVGRLSLRGGNLHLHRRKGVPTLEFMNYDRVPGSSLTFDVLGANFRCVIQGENANSGGFWQPWAVEFYYEPDLIKVDSSGELSLVPLNEYATLAASGHDPLKPALMTTATNILSEGGEVSALNCRYSSGAMTLDLGTNDLLIGRGVLIVNSHSLLIDSDGGRLTFGGNEVIIVPRVLGGSRTVRVHAPLHADGSGPKYLLVPRSSGNVELVMDGPDMIGTYDTIFANMDSSDGSKLHLGGPSDRAVTNSLAGRFALIKEGEGSLTLSGNDTRGEVTGTVVSNGILRIASANGLRSTHPGHTTVAEGGTLEVAENTLWPGQFTVKSGGYLGRG